MTQTDVRSRQRSISPVRRPLVTRTFLLTVWGLLLAAVLAAMIV